MRDRAMALRSQIIYSVYVRNHTPEGTFAALEGDLDRIRALGTDIVWLMPIHPIGVLNKKGSLGCPYSIRDYRAVNPEYGTLEDFRHLVGEIRRRGMKCIIDVVYNHTSHDSVLRAEHPEFFYRTPEGNFGNRYGDWSDVIDLDYSNPALWRYQIDTLRYWAGMTDGFRCDVASCVPAEFWEQAADEVAEVNPDAVWLAESVYTGHVQYARECGYPVASDADLYRAFDMLYPYDVQDYFDRYVDGTGRLSEYMKMLSYQDHVFPSDYVKVRFLENHDTPRAAKRFREIGRLRNWLAFVYFQKGATLLYGGQEWRCEEFCSLFDKDTFPRDPQKDISEYLMQLGRVKKECLPVDADFSAEADDHSGLVTAYLSKRGFRAAGVFTMKGLPGRVSVRIPDGRYLNHVDGSTLTVRDGKVFCDGEPLILTAQV